MEFFSRKSAKNLIALFILFWGVAQAYQADAQCSPISIASGNAVVTSAICNGSDTNTLITSYYVLLSSTGFTAPYTYVSATDNNNSNTTITAAISNDTLYVAGYVANLTSYNSISSTVQLKDSCNNPCTLYVYGGNNHMDPIQNTGSNYNLCDSVFSLYGIVQNVTNFSVYQYNTVNFTYDIPVTGATTSQTGSIINISGLQPNTGYAVSYTNACGRHYSGTSVYTNPNNYFYYNFSNTAQIVCDSAGYMGGYVALNLAGPFTLVYDTAYAQVPYMPSVSYAGDTIKFDHVLPYVYYNYEFTDSCNKPVTIFLSLYPDDSTFAASLHSINCDSTYTITLKAAGDNSRYYLGKVFGSTDGDLPLLTTTSNVDSVVIAGFSTANINNVYYVSVRDSLCHNERYIPFSLSVYNFSTPDNLQLNIIPSVCGDGNGISAWTNILGTPPYNITWLNGPNTPSTAINDDSVTFKHLVCPVPSFGSGIDTFYQFKLQDACGKVDTYKISNYLFYNYKNVNPIVLSESGGCSGGANDSSGTALIAISTYPYSNAGPYSNVSISGPGNPQLTITGGDTLGLTGLMATNDYHIMFRDSCGQDYMYTYTSAATNVPMQINVTPSVQGVCGIQPDSAAYSLDIAIANANPPYNVYLTGINVNDSLTGQSSYHIVFDSLYRATYQIKVVDACNNIQTLNYTIQNPGTYSESEWGYFNQFKGCDSLEYAFYFYGNFSNSTGLQINNFHPGPIHGYVIRNSDTVYAPEVYPGFDVTNTVQSFYFSFPSFDSLLQNDSYYVTDGCGNTYTIPVYYNIYYGGTPICDSGQLYNQYYLSYYYPSASFPLTYTYSNGSPSAPADTVFTLSGVSAIHPMKVPAGYSWTYKITDSCGRIISLVNLSGPQLPYSSFATRICTPATSGAHKGNLQIYNYNYTVPGSQLKLHQISGPSVIADTTGYFTLNNIDTGTYVFTITQLGSCAFVDTLTAKVEPFLDSVSTVFTAGCLNANKMVTYYYSNRYTASYQTLVLEPAPLSTMLNGNSYTFNNGDTVYNIPSNANIMITNNCFQDTFHSPAYIQPTIKASAGFTCISGFSLSILGAGGVPPYTYEILSASPSNYSAPLQTSNTFTGLPSVAGNHYQVRIADQCGNAFTTVVRADSVNNPLQQVGFTCVGSNYSASVDSIPNISYTWIKPDNTTIPGRTLSFNPITYADTGAYTLQLVNNITGCVSVIADTVSVKDCELQAVEAHTNLLCATGNNGTIDISAAGGTIPYTYLWNNGDTTEDRAGLTPGTYVVVIKDHVNATDTLTIVLTAPDSLIPLAIATQVTCNGGNDGSINLMVTGGVTPYTYNWSNGATTQNISALTAGNYIVTVTDSNGCTRPLTVTVTQPDSLVLSAITADLSCNNSNDGSINLSVTGGKTPYSYSWSNGATTQDLGALAAGTYTVTVTDSNGCTKPLTVTITQPDPVVIDNVIYSAGSVTVTVVAANPTSDMIYHVLWVLPDTVTIPPPNNTGIFTLPGATEAAFQISKGTCLSLIDTVIFGVPLPVKFISFTARLYNDRQGKLDWEAEEMPSLKGYQVEKSSDGNTFNSIGRIDVPPATSMTRKRYQYIDNALFEGNNFYRIKETDQDGKAVYSITQLINYSGPGVSKATLYPNPTLAMVTLEFDAEEAGSMKVWITDALGKIVYGPNTAACVKGENRVLVDVKSLSDGAYFLNYQYNGKQHAESIKFIKVTH